MLHRDAQNFLVVHKVGSELQRMILVLLLGMPIMKIEWVADANPDHTSHL